MGISLRLDIGREKGGWERKGRELGCEDVRELTEEDAEEWSINSANRVVKVEDDSALVREREGRFGDGHDSIDKCEEINIGCRGRFYLEFVLSGLGLGSWV